MTKRSEIESDKGIKKSGNCCVVCGWAKLGSNGQLLVEGAHVHPFSDNPDYDVYTNIIGLCPNHHSQFDSCSLTIDPDGIIHTLDSSDEYNLKIVVGSIAHISRGHLDYHNKRIFKGKI